MMLPRCCPVSAAGFVPRQSGRTAALTGRTIQRASPVSARKRCLAIQADRLNKTLHETCELGAAHRYGSDPTETGLSRLALDDNDAEVRRWFVSEVEKLGCKTTVDQMGNIFAVRPGKREGPPTAMASHLDTQPSGGRYDGILGVMAALEGLRTLHDNSYETEYPVAAVNWTNEEGARFPVSVNSSSVWAGRLTLEEGWGVKDILDPSKTVKSELERIGFLGETRCSHEAFSLAAHFELHIEQGPILEDNNLKVGVVKGGQAYRWFDLTLTGKACHTGSTPYASRSDALECAARIMVANKRIAKKHGGLASTGVLTLSPGSINVCPGEVKFTLDMRHPSDSTLDIIESAIHDEARRIAAEDCEKCCQLEWKCTTRSGAVVFDEGCIEAVRRAAEGVVGKAKTRDIFSGAGHDSCQTSAVCPSSMIFVPSRDGLSHNPREYTSPEDCAIGAQVLLDAVLSYDKLRASR